MRPTCNECGVEYVCKRRRLCNDGKYRCKPCVRKATCKRYRDTHVEEEKNYRKKNSAKYSARAKKWNNENKARRKEVEKKYRQSAKGKISTSLRSKRHYWADPEYQRKKAVAKQHGTTPEFIQKLEQKCQMCGAVANLSLDHMYPVSRGGKAVDGNTQMLCIPCNSFKSDRVFLADGSGYLVGVSNG